MYADQRVQRPSTTGDFEFLNKLGQGSFGVVYKVRRKADKGIYVMKQINIAQMSHNLRKEALNEVKILSSLNNAYIVKYYESFIEKNYLNIVMEYCEGGDLANLIKNSPKTLPESKVWKFLIQKLFKMVNTKLEKMKFLFLISILQNYEKRVITTSHNPQKASGRGV